MHVTLLMTIFLRIFKRFRFKYILLDLLLICYGFIILFPSSIKRALLFLFFKQFNWSVKAFITFPNADKLLFILLLVFLVFYTLTGGFILEIDFWEFLKALLLLLCLPYLFPYILIMNIIFYLFCITFFWFLLFRV